MTSRKGNDRRRGRAISSACIAIAALSTLAMAGCREKNQYLSRRDTIWLGAGDAPAHNRVVHTIDPWPVRSKDTHLTADGKRMLVGIKRYQENKSLEPGGARTNDDFVAQQPPAAPQPAPAPSN